jgi:hypothetical protein
LPGLPERHGGSCAFCQLSCDGLAPFGAAVIEIGLAPVQMRSSAWTVADRASPTPREASWSQPRAPPLYSWQKAVLASLRVRSFGVEA